MIVERCQSCEVLQLVKAGNVFISSEHIAQIGNGISLGIAYFTVLVCIPVCHAKGFHLGVSKYDVSNSNEMCHKVPIVCYLESIQSIG